MALLNGQAGEVAEPKAADAVDKKAKKNEAAKRFKERKQEREQQAYEGALKFRDELVKVGHFESLSQESKDFILLLCKDPSEKRISSGFGGPSVFTQLFGDTPKVGQKITLYDAFAKTYKGKSTLDVWVKRWAEKGIVVDCVLNKADMAKTEYVIRELPKA
jgi:hypothetical protein